MLNCSRKNTKKSILIKIAVYSHRNKGVILCKFNLHPPDDKNYIVDIFLFSASKFNGRQSINQNV
jgi:hypothetical protein